MQGCRFASIQRGAKPVTARLPAWRGKLRLMAKCWLIAALTMAIWAPAGSPSAANAQQPSHHTTVLVPTPAGKNGGKFTQSEEQEPPSSSRPLLPQNFAGWQKKSSSTSRDPAQADPANAAVLREFGFTGVESATYVRNSRKLQVK